MTFQAGFSERSLLIDDPKGILFDSAGLSCNSTHAFSKFAASGSGGRQEVPTALCSKDSWTGMFKASTSETGFWGQPTFYHHASPNVRIVQQACNWVYQFRNVCPDGEPQECEWETHAKTAAECNGNLTWSQLEGNLYDPRLNEKIEGVTISAGEFEVGLFPFATHHDSSISNAAGLKAACDPSANSLQTYKPDFTATTNGFPTLVGSRDNRWRIVRVDCGFAWEFKCPLLGGEWTRVAQTFPEGECGDNSLNALFGSVTYSPNSTIAESLVEYKVSGGFCSAGDHLSSCGGNPTSKDTCSFCVELCNDWEPAVEAKHDFLMWGMIAVCSLVMLLCVLCSVSCGAKSPSAKKAKNDVEVPEETQRDPSPEVVIIHTAGQVEMSDANTTNSPEPIIEVEQTCWKGHGLASFPAPCTVYWCSVCKEAFDEYDPMYRCIRCKWDVCPQCLQAKMAVDLMEARAESKRSRKQEKLRVEKARISARKAFLARQKSANKEYPVEECGIGLFDILAGKPVEKVSVGGVVEHLDDPDSEISWKTVLSVGIHLPVAVLEGLLGYSIWTNDADLFPRLDQLFERTCAGKAVNEDFTCSPHITLNSTCWRVVGVWLLAFAFVALVVDLSRFVVIVRHYCGCYVQDRARSMMAFVALFEDLPTFLISGYALYVFSVAERMGGGVFTAPGVDWNNQDMENLEVALGDFNEIGCMALQCGTLVVVAWVFVRKLLDLCAAALGLPRWRFTGVNCPWAGKQWDYAVLALFFVVCVGLAVLSGLAVQGTFRGLYDQYFGDSQTSILEMLSGDGDETTLAPTGAPTFSNN